MLRVARGMVVHVVFAFCMLHATAVAVEPLDAVEHIIEEFGDGSGAFLRPPMFEEYYKALLSGDGHGHDDHGHRMEDGHDNHGDHGGHDDHAGEECEPHDHVFEEHDINQDGMLEYAELQQAASHAFVQRMSGCVLRSETACPLVPSTTKQAWGYGFLSAIIISLVSFVGVLILPVNHPRVRKILLEVMVSFAVGALLGDALMHLYPEITGVHSHGAEEEPHRVTMLEEKDFLWQLAVAGVAVVTFFLLERIIHSFHLHHQRDEKGGTAHSHVNLHLPSDSDHHNHQHGHKPEIQASGYINLIADGFHNFTDGLALGAAWSTNLSLGLATSLAVVFHEIPQEFGDFAILLQAGFTRKQALLFNLLSACVSIVGLIIALAVGTNATDANNWILAFTLGGFLYIAIADMIPELQKQLTITHLLYQLGGLLLGFVVMMILGMFEGFTTCVN